MKDLEKKVEQYANHIMSSLAGAHGSFKDTRADEDIVAGILKHFAATVRQEAYEDAAKIRLSNKEAAEFLGISPLTLKQWRHEGTYKIPFTPVGRKIVYDLADLEAFMAKRRVEAPRGR